MQLYQSDYKIRSLSPAETQTGINVLKKSLCLAKGEKVLVVTNQDKLIAEGAIFFEVAKNFTDKLQLAVIQPLSHHGGEPKPELANLMTQYDAILLVTTYSLSHTQARKNASNAGARIVSMPGITSDIILRTLSYDYFDQVAHLSKNIAGLLTMSESARLTSPSGTDLQFSLTGRNGQADTGIYSNSGDFGNLPAGEGFIAPKEGKTQGLAVFDGAFADTLIDQPIKVTFKDGVAIKIAGGLGAKQLEIMLNTLGPDSRHVAELGIGTNKNCQLGSSLLEMEKVYGTCHVAIGNNKHFGGTIDTPYHADGVILKPTLELDGKIVLKDGELIL